MLFVADWSALRVLPAETRLTVYRRCEILLYESPAGIQNPDISTHGGCLCAYTTHEALLRAYTHLQSFAACLYSPSNILSLPIIKKLFLGEVGKSKLNEESGTYNFDH